MSDSSTVHYKEQAMVDVIPDSKLPGANVGPIWGWQDPGGPHVGPMNLAIWDIVFSWGQVLKQLT